MVGLLGSVTQASSLDSYLPLGEKLHKVARPGGGACLGSPAIQQFGVWVQAKSVITSKFINQS